MHVPIPLRGVLSAPFRAFGIRPSRMHPNLCTICELGFSTVMRARKVMIDATVMFADLRNYTALSQSLPADTMSGMLDAFYDSCAGAIWEQDGLLNKTIGDAVMAVFNFPISHADHAARALRAARDLQRRCNGLEVGIGISTGMLSFGEFGKSHRDLTAIGTVVNTAARAQSAAGPGKILVTKAVVDSVGEELAGSTSGQYQLKGFAEAIELYAA
jgi:class 3 adenylate cyclase